MASSTAVNEQPPPPSQTSSHFPLLEPASGATLFERETARRADTGRRDRRLCTGCAEIDDAVLLGGFERGAVVGVSAEVAEVGLLVGLQTVAHTMVFAGDGNRQRTGVMDINTPRRNKTPRAAIITTLAATAVLPTLRDVIRAQVQAKLGPAANHRQDEVNGEVRRCLERIAVSRVFDVEGLWEVVSELETPSPPPPVATPDGEKEEGTGKENVGTSVGTTTIDEGGLLPALGELPERSSAKVFEEGGRVVGIPPLRPSPRIERTEVGDSEEDEDEELSLPSSPDLPLQQPASPPPQPPRLLSSPSPPPAAPAAVIPTIEPRPTDEDTSQTPDIILITNFSSLLTNLFTCSVDNKANAHTTLQLLSSHLRYLTRSSSGPLVMLLNTTTTSSSPSAIAANPTNITNTATDAAKRPLEPTLRSIFNPVPPLPPEAGARGAREADNRRRQGINKPAFGVTFAQFLDLHLLCTRAPRTRADAEALFAPPAAVGGGVSMGLGEVKCCWVVEVLLDEQGVLEWVGNDAQSLGGDITRWEGKGEEDGVVRQNGRCARRSREQRWGAVDVRGGVRIVDAFAGAWREERFQGPVRVAAGFGGPPPRGL